MSASGLNWPEVQRRLEAARAAMERGWAPDAEEAKRILKARARALAREPAKDEADDDYIEVVEFVLAYEQYAVETRHVREIHPLEHLTPLPCTPAFVLGIVNVRGEILSVIDLRKFFDLPEKGLTDLNKVIVLESGPMVFGILADAVIGAKRIRLAGIQPSLPTLTGVREAYLKGVTAERTVILDAEKLLADETIVVQEQVEG
ncbi:MAG: chemotaxis protein CheW [Betaproteobacteria bacterium]|nr:chemotaxis protein CheW [Betaproteobacteria bacterium]MBI3053917.1 chemotaxis protein CheW [Betaproteobacteria bacterium]